MDLNTTSALKNHSIYQRNVADIRKRQKLVTCTFYCVCL